ncbi:Trehalose phosphorylase [Escovopsis weberi]|uniref:Trehalose phosphorylase n=1 Tax=Escovopsis weberi TaxID=150374 RepID=A0A0M8MYK4_ESCWE|nr:Trehalose phosphorylase [Escovopsis weberi]
MKLDEDRHFSTGTSIHRKRRLSFLSERAKSYDSALTTLFLGISAITAADGSTTISLAIRDNIYLVDFCVKTIPPHSDTGKENGLIAQHIIDHILDYEHANFAKFVGAGLPDSLRAMIPSLGPRLWLEMDIVPIVLPPDEEREGGEIWDAKHVDEQADSMSRKCMICFGPSLLPFLQVGWHGQVRVDAGFRAQLTSAEHYQDTSTPEAWKAVTYYARKMQPGSKKIKIAFFSSTPQGGGVALMRHALVRFSRLMGVNLSWYVPKPQPGVFRITKNVHNILQGVSQPDQQISRDEKDAIRGWITDNATRYWFSRGGPLRPPEDGGADVVVIDDPQMPGLIPLIKKVTPNRPVLYRSHIQIRADLVAKKGSPQADVWDFLWSDIRQADLFISHPVPSFVPENVPEEKVAYMPATTDWLDGLNKKIDRWDSGYYGHLYNNKCYIQRMTKLEWPDRQYILQIARFDPAKGIPTVIESYAKFRRRLAGAGIENAPQLVVAGHGSVDDPDYSIIYDQTMMQLEEQYPYLIGDVSVMRLDPVDQVLNCLISHAHVVLQLSTREGFEVKVSEALHAGRPVIGSLAGGIPLQIKHGVNGYLVQPGDADTVAAYLFSLFTDRDLHDRMSRAAESGVSDEVSTVGNAICWYYLASTLMGVEAERGAGEEVEFEGNKGWVYDMARAQAGLPLSEQDNQLPRDMMWDRFGVMDLVRSADQPVD